MMENKIVEYMNERIERFEMLKGMGFEQNVVEKGLAELMACKDMAEKLLGREIKMTANGVEI